MSETTPDYLPRTGRRCRYRRLHETRYAYAYGIEYDDEMLYGVFQGYATSLGHPAALIEVEYVTSHQGKRENRHMRTLLNFEGSAWGPPCDARRGRVELVDLDGGTFQFLD